jgi:hypothetical protein
MRNNLEKKINEIVESIPSKHLIATSQSLLETYDLINALETRFNYYEKDSQLTEESWQKLLDLFKQAAHSQSLHNACKEINKKLYCVKQFSNVKFILASDIEDILKYETKKYFSQLSTCSTDEELVDTFKSLPFEFTSLFTRYLVNILFKKDKDLFLPKEVEAQEYYKKILALKNEFIKNINDCSLGKQNVFSIVDAQLLLDCKAFFDYTPTNTGSLEYIVRMFLNPKTRKKLNDMFGEKRISYMLEQALLHPSYIQYLKNIKTGVEQPYFNSDGLQNTERKPTFDDIIKSTYTPQEFVPDLNNTQTPPQSIQTQQPSPEELQNPEQPSPEEP